MISTVKVSASPSPQSVFATFADNDAPLITLDAPVWLAWRAGGRQIAGAWYEAPDLRAAITRSRAALSVDDRPDALEIGVTRDWKAVAAADVATAFPNSSRGIAGVEIRLGAHLARIAPSTMIATNRAALREIERFAEMHKLTPALLAAKAQIRRFEADQFLILLDEGRCVQMWRGGQVVPPEAVSPALLDATIAGLCGWMRNNLRDDGRMTYKYWPSRGDESKTDNTIRQFMATVALGRIAARSGDPVDARGACANLRYNMAQFYAEQDGLGMVTYEGKAKLGAIALAALAILEFRAAGLIAPDAYAAEFAALIAGIQHLWQADGSFRTFLTPADRNDNQNFYPGEALLFLAAWHRQTRDAGLAHRIMTSFRYYRSWHLAQPNPAFVPWHSQAYVMLYEDLPDQELVDFVFDRNDWILEMQQWNARLPADFQGRFYNPQRPDYGPPHASSTGVYMEGLADAWRLADRLGDEGRANAYATALRRGLRAIRQLQFRDRAIDGFYVSRPNAVMGGLRTETYNNEIRVDNVQHCLMALLKLEAEPGFQWSAAA